MKRFILGILLLSLVAIGYADIPPLVAGTKLGDASYQLMMVENLTGVTNVGLGAALKRFLDGKGQDTGLLLSIGASQADKIALQFSTLNKLSFRDNALVIYSSADVQLDIDADTELELAIGKLDVNSSDNITIDCSDNTKTIAVGAATSGLAITIGHTTSETTIADNLTTTGNTAVGGTLGVTGTTTTTALNVVGAVDINATTYDLDATDDIDIDTSDTTGGIAIGTVTSGVPISIGHTTSETTVNDNLTITGTTTLNATTLSGTLTGGASVISGTGFDINGGTIDGATIGATSATSAKLTTLTTSGIYSASDNIVLNTNVLILDASGDESITSDTDGQIDFRVSAADELKLTATNLYPSTDTGLILGIDTTNEWADIFTYDIQVENDINVGGDVWTTGSTITTGDIYADGNVYASGLLAHDGTPQSLSGAGAINATTTVTLLTTTGANALTIANGTIDGQMKYIVHIVDGGAGTLTGANLLGTNVVFTNAGENATLIWIDSISDWAVVGVSEDIYTP